MAKIMCITSGLTGILNASFELVNRLEAAGHTLVYASPKPVEQKVKAQGIRYIQLPEIKTENLVNIPSFNGPLKKGIRFLYKIKNRKKLQKEAASKIRPTVFEVTVKAENPDLLILDVELHEYIITAHSYTMPMIILSQWFSLWQRKGLPYLLHDTIPGRGWKGTPIGIKLSWKKVRAKRWWTFTKKKIISVGTDRRSVLLKYASEVNFPIENIKENNWPGPFTYGKLPVMAMVARELEFNHSERPNLSYVGPMVAENRTEIAIGKSDLSKVSEALKIKKETGAKLIYCSVSTLHQGDLDFIKKVIKAVETMSQYLLIIGLGGLVDDKRFENLGRNIFACSYIPQLYVLSYADLSINHGGIHTINECIYHKTPMLVYSGKRSDQNGCAARIAYHRLGIMADKDIDTVHQIRDKIKLVLDSAVYRNNIEKLNAQFDTYNKERVLEQYISNTLKIANTK